MLLLSIENVHVGKYMKTLRMPNQLDRQQGIVLIVGLVMVLLISIIALASIKGSGLQEAIAGNMRGRNVTFQAADSGIAYAERTVQVPTIPIICDDGVNAQGILCWDNLEYTKSKNTGGSAMYLDDVAFLANANKPNLLLPNVASQPAVIIEKLSPYRPIMSGDDLGFNGGNGSIADIVPYRITSKGVGITEDSSAITQSTYNRTQN